MMALLGCGFLFCLIVGYLYGLHDGACREQKWLEKTIQDVKNEYHIHQ